MTNRELLKDAYIKLISGPTGGLTPATILTSLGNQLAAKDRTFNGVFRHSSDFVRLSDEQAGVALELIGQFKAPTADPDAARDAARRRSAA